MNVEREGLMDESNVVSFSDFKDANGLDQSAPGSRGTVRSSVLRTVWLSKHATDLRWMMPPVLLCAVWAYVQGDLRDVTWIGWAVVGLLSTCVASILLSPTWEQAPLKLVGMAVLLAAACYVMPTLIPFGLVLGAAALGVMFFVH